MHSRIYSFADYNIADAMIRQVGSVGQQNKSTNRLKRWVYQPNLPAVSFFFAFHRRYDYVDNQTGGLKAISDGLRIKVIKH